MAGFVVVLIVLAIIGLLVWQFIETKSAVATTCVETTLDPRRALEAVNSAFEGPRSMLWTNANGPGSVNKRRRGKDGGIVMSIDIEAQPGGTAVSMWASQTNLYLVVFANFAGVVNRRKRAIARLLTV